MSSATHGAVYSGSFDPITYGHLDVLQRARGIFDEIVVAIGRNPEKQALFTLAEREAMTRSVVAELVAAHPAGASVRVETFTGLTVDFARSVGACALLRGIRNSSDLVAECQLAITNRQVAGIESVFLVTGESFAYTSSSLIKQIAALGGSLDRIAPMVPKAVLEALRTKRIDPENPLGRLVRDDPGE